MLRDNCCYMYVEAWFTERVNRGWRKMLQADVT